MTETIKPSRSGINPENIQEVIDASVSAKHATLGNQQQYESPAVLAAFLNSLLPTIPYVQFDPQCASGMTLKSGSASWTRKLGFEIDRRFENQGDGVTRVIGNCVNAWEVMADVFPEIEIECQTANPPFGLLWKVGSGKEDSTEFTWRKIQQHAAKHGFGWLLANSKTIERLGYDKHERCYAYLKFPVGWWKQCDVAVGIVLWDAHPNRPPRIELEYKSLDVGEHRGATNKLKAYYVQFSHEHDRERFDAYTVSEAFDTIQKIVREEKGDTPEFNVWLDKHGRLKTYLSTRAKVKRRLTREDINRMTRIDGSHPLTLTPDRDTRKILAELVECGLYTLQPEAKTAIENALSEVNRLQAPIMRVTPFETVGYAEQEEHLKCKTQVRGDNNLWLTKGQAYEISTDAYSFVEKFIRKKPHFDEETQRMYTMEHECELSGSDKYISIRDDRGMCHKFMDRPEKDSKFQHPEALLWTIFDMPEVKTVAETHPQLVEKNKLALAMCELVAGFTYFPGQTEYISRVAVKDYAIIAANTGVGKSLIALSLIQMKGPNRALIIAPQGTVKQQVSEDEEEDEEAVITASQWLEEVRRFAPGIPTFRLFDWADYKRICKSNGGTLPSGLYVTYYEAFFKNSVDV